MFLPAVVLGFADVSMTETVRLPLSCGWILICRVPLTASPATCSKKFVFIIFEFLFITCGYCHPCCLANDLISFSVTRWQPTRMKFLLTSLTAYLSKNSLPQFLQPPLALIAITN